MTKKYLPAFIACIIVISANAQISITSTEMPHAGDTARLTKAVNNLFLNYSATGSNHNWNFSSLKSDTQQLREYQSVSSTGLLYALTFADIFFNPNRANVAATGNLSFPVNNYLTLDNPFNFYYRNSSQYRQVGIGADVTAFGISLGGIPTVFDQFDVIYNLPLNFGDQDTSYSSYQLNIPLVPVSYAYRQIRINNVDGWGSLQTPHGTYNVLRVKTTLLGHDSIGFDTLGLPPIEIDRAEINEYKWIAAGEVVPVMQVNTQKILGIEIITDIFFRDDFLNVYPGSLSNSYCAGQSISIPYTAEGTFNTGGILIPANQFRAQLSDASGSFANPVQIGQLTSNVSGMINATIPVNTPEGSGYRIRIVSTSPATEGPDNGTDIYIATQPVSVISQTAGSIMCDSASFVLSATAGNGYSYQWQLNGVDIIGETSINYTATQTGDYTVATTNICGTANSNNMHVYAPVTPVALLNASSGNFCYGDSLLLYTNFEAELSYQWIHNGNVVVGATDTIMYATEGGDYSLVASNGYCTDTSSIITVTMNSLPAAVIALSGNNVICSGDSVELFETSATGLAYQWQLDGIDITGATTSQFTVFQPGDYTIVATNMCGAAPSNIIHIDVLTPPMAIINSSGNSICQGDSLLMTIAYENGISYQWLLDGNIIAGATDTLMYATQGGNYSVVAGNGICADVLSPVLAVSVINAPVAIITATGNTTFCMGDSVELFETSGSGNSFQWQIDSIDIPGATLNSFVVTQSGNYNVVTTNSCSSSVSNIINVIVNPLPAVPVITQQIDSLGSTAAASYQWYLNGVLISGANNQYYIPAQNGDYTVVITDANGCTNSSSVFTFNTMAVFENQNTHTVTVTPNPVNEILNINIHSDNGKSVVVSLVSCTGAEAILMNSQKTQPGWNHLSFDLKSLSLASGIYFVKVRDDLQVIYAKIVKQ